jgi:endoglycosylceramidase
VRRAAILAVLVAGLLPVPAATAAQGGPSAAAPQSPLSHVGRWVTDRSGRVVILHGLNMVNKRPPYQPGAVGFNGPDADFLRRYGFNTVRLGLIYKAVEPQPGRYAAGYLRKERSIERLLAKRGIYSLVDFHQDLYNEKFGGEGWPDWAVLDDGQPADPLTGFPASYITSPGLNRAFDNFWANKGGPGSVPLQTRYAGAWARVASVFRSDRGVLGYDLLNEPWPGSTWMTCANTAGCPAFDSGSLQPFYERVIPRIRSADKQSLVFYEPQVLFNFGSDTNIGRIAARNLGFSFHVYCLAGLVAGGPSGCDDLEELSLDNADAHAKATDTALMLSEFGATDDIATLTRLANAADRHMVSWQEWHYCGCDDPTTQASSGDVQAVVKDPRKPPRGKNVFHDKLRALSRPYPQAIAGTPHGFSFDPDSRRFQLLYSTRRASGHGSFRRGLTDVFIPRVQYRRGYCARVKGATVRQRTIGTQHLVLRALPKAKRVQLVVIPAPGPTC